MTVLAVILGAALGAPARLLIDSWITARVAGTTALRAFPWGLLTVNATGSLLAGLVAAGTDGILRTLLLAGFCGAFTTFSGFAWEATRLWSSRRTSFWLAVLAMPLGCTLAFLAGWQLVG